VNLIYLIRKTRWKLAGKILLSLLVLFISLEATVRFHYFGLDGFSFQKMGDSFQDMTRAGLVQRSEDPEISFELKPNLETRFRNKRFATNSQGFRDKEYSLSKPPSTFRVAVVGASYVMGWEVEQDETFHAVLEDRLNRESKGTRYEFINMGVAGYSPWRSLAVVKNKALKYGPDLILFATTPYMYRKDPRPPLPTTQTAGHPFFTSYFKYFLRLRIRMLLHRLGRGESAGAATMAQARRRIDGIFSQLEGIAKTTGIPICVVILENKNYSLEIVPEIHAAVRDHGLRLVDATEPFLRDGFPKHCTHRLDCHPNAEAHRIFAGVIHDFLVEGHLLESAQMRTNHGP
jgi:hypothetical protein